MRTKRLDIGFTIVELLIVITVIGILVAITVVAFSGIQQKARNTARLAAVKDLSKIINLYAVQNNSYPFPTSSVCVGEGYPDFDADGTKDCREVIGGTNKQHEDTGSIAMLKTISPRLPNVNTPPIKHSSNGISHLGLAAEYSSKTFNGVPFDYQLIYFLEGTAQDCGLSNLLVGSWPTFTSSTNNYSSTGGGMTYCYVYLPRP